MIKLPLKNLASHKNDEFWHLVHVRVIWNDHKMTEKLKTC